MTDLRALFARPGANDLAWTDPGLPDRPMMLRSARPRRCGPDTPVLFVHHGVLRNGGDYRDYWLPLVDEADLLVIAPEFPADTFPGPAWYNFGNLRDADGRPNPRQRWTYGVDARVFSALRDQGLTAREVYGAFGHSAGGQFVHRMVSLGFRDRLRVAVTANAGTYAMPDLAIDFPYGLGGLRLNDAALAALLATPLLVMAGDRDVDTASEHFPKDPPAMLQGPTRFARAHAYLDAAQAASRRLGRECAWRIRDVPGVGHEGDRMSASAAPILSEILHRPAASPGR